MGHRQMYYMSQIPEARHYQLLDGHCLGTHLHLDDGAYFLPSECVPPSGVNSVPLSNISTRPNEYPSAGFRFNVLNCRGPIVVSTNHNHLHPSSSYASNQTLRDAHFGLYNSLPGRQAGRHIQMDNARLPCKRRRPPAPMILDRQSSNGYYGVAIISNFPNLSNNFDPPITRRRHWDPIGTVYGLRMYANSDVGQRSVRNVRRRLDDIPVNHSPSVFPRNYPPTENARDPSMDRQWNSTYESIHPGRSVLSSGRSVLSSGRSFNYDINQSFQRGSQTSGGVNLDHNFDVFSTRNVLTILSSHIPLSQRRFDLSTYEQRANAHTTASNYVPQLGLSNTFSDRSSGLGILATSRFSRSSLSVTSRGIERSTRDMNMYDRHLAFVSENITRRRLERRDLPTMDQMSPYYESGHMFDEHWDMRLDIDNMGYEELLALGERIGNVNTGLSEDSISSFLFEKTYFSSDKAEDGQVETCPICLEEYKDQDGLGRLQCGHDFHFCCIKEWLLIKNVCPMCKTPVGADSSK